MPNVLASGEVGSIAPGAIGPSSGPAAANTVCCQRLLEGAVRVRRIPQQRPDRGRVQRLDGENARRRAEQRAALDVRHLTQVARDLRIFDLRDENATIVGSSVKAGKCSSGEASPAHRPSWMIVA